MRATAQQHQDPSAVPSTHVKSWVCLHRSATLCYREVELGGEAVVQPILSYLKGQREGVIEQNTQYSPLTSKHM